MRFRSFLIAVPAASLIWTAAGCGVVNSLLGREQNLNHWLQQNQARMFRETDEPDPKVEPFTHFAAGQLLEGKKQIHKAIIQYRKALDLNPKFIGAHNRLAICLDKIGQHTEAESALRRAIKVKPKLAYLWNNLAFSLMAQKRWRDAERELGTALQLKPDYQRARVNLGIVMSKLARRDEAFQQFQMVLGDARAYYNIGLLDKAGGRYAQAAESFRNAIVLEPKLTAAKIQLDKLRTMASAEAQRLERQAGHAAPNRSVVATQALPWQPAPVQTIRVAVPTQHDRERDDAVVERAVVAQAEPDLSGMSIGRPNDPVFAAETEHSGADFTWEVPDISAAAEGTVNNRPAAAVAVALPAQRTAAKARTLAAMTPRPVRAQLSDAVPTEPPADRSEPGYRESGSNSLPFLTYEEPCDVRDVGRSAPRPERRIALCAEDELIDQFVLGESGFDLTPNLATSVPQLTATANRDGHDAATRERPDASTLDEWQRFAWDHHLATDGRNLPNVLMRLQGDLAKNWRPPHQPSTDSAPVPTMPNPAAEIEWSVTRAP